MTALLRRLAAAALRPLIARIERELWLYATLGQEDDQ